MHDREVDLDLVELTGMDGRVDHPITETPEAVAFGHSALFGTTSLNSPNQYGEAGKSKTNSNRPALKSLTTIPTTFAALKSSIFAMILSASGLVE